MDVRLQTDALPQGLDARDVREQVAEHGLGERVPATPRRLAVTSRHVTSHHVTSRHTTAKHNNGNDVMKGKSSMRERERQAVHDGSNRFTVANPPPL